MNGGTIVHREVYDIVNEPLVDGTVPLFFSWFIYLPLIMKTIIISVRNQVAIAKLLIECGADVDARSGFIVLNIPLHLFISI